MTETPWVAALRADMDEQGFTISALARVMGLDRGTISRWFDGQTRPSDAKLRALALLLGRPQDHYVDLRRAVA